MWADLVAWFQSPAGARVLQTAVVPAVAILVAGVVAALIARAALRSALARADRDQAASAVAALVEAARATTDPDGSRGDRRRVQRLRTEADVRLRLLPLAGATTAADWASARMDDLQQRTTDGAGSGPDDLRDRLVAWVARPGRAKRLFAAPPQSPSKRADRPAPAPIRPEAPLASSPKAEEQDGAEAASRPAVASAVAPPASASPEAASDEADPPEQPEPQAVPAWRRTVSAKRLQQERAASRSAPTDGGNEATAPVQVQPGHRATAAPTADPDEPGPADAHQPARHAAPEDEAQQPAAPAAVSQGQDAPRSASDDQPASGPRTPTPAWLDDYDDEAQVTQNMDLRTPPPVAATSVRDRSPSGEDIVPRT